MVARGNMKVFTYEEAFCGLVNLYNTKKDFFLGKLKKLDVVSLYVVNKYLHGFKKQNIYTVEIPEVFECGVKVLIIVKLIY